MKKSSSSSLLLPRSPVLSQLECLGSREKAPAFEALDDRGKHGVESFRGKKLLLVYFYPAAMTCGCTKQACAFETIVKSGRRGALKLSGSVAINRRDSALFKRAERLNFTYWQTRTEGGKAFGVPAGKGGSIDRFVKVKVHPA